jgi:hypothetical protein
MSWRDRIVSNPAIMGGQVCIKGTRIPVSVVLDNLAAGLSAAEITGCPWAWWWGRSCIPAGPPLRRLPAW